MDKLSERDRVILNTIFDPLQPFGINTNANEVLNEAIDVEEDPYLDDEAKDFLKRAILLSESGKLEEALELFAIAQKKAPHSASILNDRAQALRLAGRNREALKDLSLAVEYSGGRGRVGIQALCQRAALYRCLEREDEAKEDFSRAAEAGSTFAKSQLVAMNPYAAMCNAMLRKIAQDEVQR